LTKYGTFRIKSETITVFIQKKMFETLRNISHPLKH